MTAQTIESWVDEQFVAQHEEEEQLVRLTVRIEPAAAAELVRLAERLGNTKSATANGLLEAAIYQALAFLDHPERFQPAEAVSE